MDDNRTRLLDCALDLFSRHGYDAVGVQQVADAANLKKPTLYHYFGSKSGLLRTLITENIALLFGALDATVLYNRNVLTPLEAVALTYFAFARQRPRFYRLLLGLWFAPLESEGYRAVVEVNQEQQQRLEALFLRAAQDHGNMRGRHQAYAATFLGMLNTYIALALNGYAELEPELARGAVRQFMHGIFS